MILYTIGIYRWTVDRFFDEIASHNIETLIDVRQRRGVRGSEYAFSNAKRLGARLGEMGIGYVHWKDIAPSKEIRTLQYAQDVDQGVKKRERSVLSGAFVDAYNSRVLAVADRSGYVQDLQTLAPAALLCVEHEADACHRSLVAKWIAEADPDVEVVDL